jgi:serpin B
MRLIRYLSLTGLPLLLVACGEAVGPIDDLPRELSVAEQHLVSADNAFAFKLFREINRQDTTGGNVFISPLSVGMALGMAYNGAAGATRDSMQRALELQDLTLDDVNASYRSLIDLLTELDPSVAFTIANSIWHDLKWTPLQPFLDATNTYFDAVVQGLDFKSASAAPTINAWVDEATRGKIPEIVPDPIPDDVIAYLINAIYFKGDWTYQFDKDRTRQQAFYRLDGSTVNVDMMSYEAESPIKLAYDDGVEIVDLPYGGGAFSMTIVLPSAAPGAPDADELSESLEQNQWNAWIAALDSTDRFVSMPKYTLEWKDDLAGALRALGMGNAFCEPPPVTADFSNMFPVGPGDVCITRVLHKTYVDVNEEGTEAAAVTAVEFAPTSMPLSTVVDRPFLFAIRERYSGTILFMGKIVDPTAG